MLGKGAWNDAWIAEDEATCAAPHNRRRDAKTTTWSYALVRVEAPPECLRASAPTHRAAENIFKGITALLTGRGQGFNFYQPWRRRNNSSVSNVQSA